MALFIPKGYRSCHWQVTSLTAEGGLFAEVAWMFELMLSPVLMVSIASAPSTGIIVAAKSWFAFGSQVLGTRHRE
jgi:hypothetical protein